MLLCYCLESRPGVGAMVSSGLANTSDSSRPHRLSYPLINSQGSQDHTPPSRLFPRAGVEGTTGKVVWLTSIAHLELPGSQQGGKVSISLPTVCTTHSYQSAGRGPAFPASLTLAMSVRLFLLSLIYRQGH